jgi:hypothetical protein
MAHHFRVIAPKFATVHPSGLAIPDESWVSYCGGWGYSISRLGNLGSTHLQSKPFKLSANPDSSTF